MHSRKEKLKAVELLVKYGMSPASAIRDLGCPCRATLYAWHGEYLASGCDMPSTSVHSKHAEEQKRAAIDHLFKHGQYPTRTMRALGHPSQGLLAVWIDELEPSHRPKRSSARRVSHETKLAPSIAPKFLPEFVAGGLNRGVQCVRPRQADPL